MVELKNKQTSVAVKNKLFVLGRCNCEMFDSVTDEFAMSKQLGYD